MATRTAKLRVEIDGEKEYKQAISELNKGNQVLASEMRKLSAEYKGNEDSVEALTAKGDLLERQLLQQRDKVQTLRDALANAAEQYGEADRRTQEWQIKLNDAETAQINLERAIDENNKSIDEQKEGFVEETRAVGSLGDQVSDLAGKLGVSKQHLSAVLHGERASKRLLSAVWRERPELVTPAALKASGLTKATIGKAVAK